MFNKVIKAIDTPTMLLIVFLANFFSLAVSSVFLNVTFSNLYLTGLLTVTTTITLIVVLSKYVGSFFHLVIVIFNLFSIINMYLIVTKNSHGYMTGINAFINYLSFFIIGVIIATLAELLENNFNLFN